MQPPRFTKNQQQEQRSRGQLQDCLGEFGWKYIDISPDTGEDVLIQIYDNEVSTGLSFLVQLKSTLTLEKITLKNGCISHPFEVKDLLHWNDSSPPTVLAVWDVNKRNGCWITVTEAIKNLEIFNPDWQHQKSARVHIFSSNRFDYDGLREIRRILAHYFYPSVSLGKKLEMQVTFVFPHTTQGLVARKALERHFEAGDSVEVTGEYIREVKFSDWYARLYGDELNPSEASVLKLGTSTSKESVPTKLDLISMDGNEIANIPYLDFRVVKQGFNEITFNEHQQIAFCVTQLWNLVEKHLSLSFDLIDFPINVHDAKNILVFMHSINKAEKIRFTLFAHQERVEFEASNTTAPIIEQNFIKLIEQLCFIQQITKQNLIIKSWSIGNEEARTIDFLMQVFEKGRANLRGLTVKTSLGKQGLHSVVDVIAHNGLLKFSVSEFQNNVLLLEVELELGFATWEIIAKPAKTLVELEELLASMSSEDIVKIDFFVKDGFGEFPAWIPKT